MKNVESWWVEELPNRVFHLLINTKNKYEDYHRYTDERFLIGEYNKYWEECILHIPKFLPENVKFICTEMQEKDQISFYWIPIAKDYIKNRNIILSSNEN